MHRQVRLAVTVQIQLAQCHPSSDRFLEDPRRHNPSMPLHFPRHSRVHGNQFHCPSPTIHLRLYPRAIYSGPGSRSDLPDLENVTRPMRAGPDIPSPLCSIYMIRGLSFMAVPADNLASRVPVGQVESNALLRQLSLHPLVSRPASSATTQN